MFKELTYISNSPNQHWCYRCGQSVNRFMLAYVDQGAVRPHYADFCLTCLDAWSHIANVRTALDAARTDAPFEEAQYMRGIASR